MGALRAQDKVHHKTFFVNFAPDKDDLREMNSFLAQLGKHGAMRAIKSEKKLKNYIIEKVQNFKDQIDDGYGFIPEVPKMIDGKPTIPNPKVIVLTFASGDDLSNEFVEDMVKAIENTIGNQPVEFFLNFHING